MSIAMQDTALEPKAALAQAIDIVGGVSAMSRAIGVTPSAVSQWEQAPAERVIAIEAATGKQITRHQLRPDLYPEDD